MKKDSMKPCPKCGSTKVWVYLYDLPSKLVEALEDETEEYVKIDISDRKVKCAKCGCEYYPFNKGETKT